MPGVPNGIVPMKSPALTGCILASAGARVAKRKSRRLYEDTVSLKLEV
jgi:hypothetical protein